MEDASDGPALCPPFTGPQAAGDRAAVCSGKKRCKRTHSLRSQKLHFLSSENEPLISKLCHEQTETISPPTSNVKDTLESGGDQLMEPNMLPGLHGASQHLTSQAPNMARRNFSERASFPIRPALTASTINSFTRSSRTRSKVPC